MVHGALLTSFHYFKLKFVSLVKQQVDLCASAPRGVFVTSWRTLGRLLFVNWELSAPPQRLQLKKKKSTREVQDGKREKVSLLLFPLQIVPSLIHFSLSPVLSSTQSEKSSLQDSAAYVTNVWLNQSPVT